MHYLSQFSSRQATRTRRESLRHTLHAGAGLWVPGGTGATAPRISKKHKEPFDMNALGGNTGTGRNVASGRPIETVRREVGKWLLTSFAGPRSPKTQKAYCPLTDCPSDVDTKQLGELGIALDATTKAKRQAKG